MQVPIKIKKLHSSAVIPKTFTKGSAGFDLHASMDIIIRPEERMLIPTGLAFEIPEGYEMQIRPRSGLSARTKLRIANSPGTIDSDYRGEVCIIIENVGFDDGNADHYIEYLDGSHRRHTELFPVGTYKIREGDRIAQGVIQSVIRPVFNIVDNLGTTERGERGFGSTGVNNKTKGKKRLPNSEEKIVRIDR